MPNMPASTSPSTNLEHMAKVKKVQELFMQGFKHVVHTDDEINEMMQICGEDRIVIM
jgi:hypothetical protein